MEANDLYRDLPPLYMYRSRTSVYFANRIALPDDKKRQLLEQAAEDARKALRFFDVNDRELAKFYVARGIALEDLAMLVEKQPQKQAERYKEAVSMFRSALDNDRRNARKVKAQYRVALARCEYRASDDNLEWLAVRVAMLGVEAEVHEPPELREQLRELARRIERSVERTA